MTVFYVFSVPSPGPPSGHIVCIGTGVSVIRSSTDVCVFELVVHYAVC